MNQMENSIKVIMDELQKISDGAMNGMDAERERQLEAYEATNMTPAQVFELKSAYNTMVKELYAHRKREHYLENQYNAYKLTNMTPEQILRMQEDYNKACRELQAYKKHFCDMRQVLDVKEKAERYDLLNNILKKKGSSVESMTGLRINERKFRDLGMSRGEMVSRGEADIVDMIISNIKRGDFNYE